MHCMLRIVVFCFVLASLGLGASSSASDMRLVVIVHPETPVTSLSADELVSVFTMSQRRWSNGEPIAVFNLHPGSNIRVYFDRVVLGMDPDQAARFWIDRRIRDGGGSPLKAPSPAVMFKVISALPRSIGYVPESQLGPGVRVVARIMNGRVVPEKQTP